ncbi:MAG TPA: FliA/WhiG family RNA polymerase sigma factor [Solirubrobacteraceae bacterium]|jgi:RNA polymerase sigma factor for flagellar operon FliA|nr:FliA/WhiG family RNA polymerase sigma factor [Solirubrobacteraceae bacterium]
MATTTKSTRLSSDETMDLWAEYKRTGNPRLRDRLVLTFAPMVKYIVYRKAREIPARCEVDDFLSCGLEALIRSIDRFDPAKGATLERYAWTRIHGAVLDELRRNDWAPRSLRRWDRDLDKTREDFIRLEGRRPTHEELADAMGVTSAELHQRRDQAARAHVGSLNTVVLTDDDTQIERIDTLPSDDRDGDPELSAARSQAKERLRAAFGTLPERERKVAVLLYVRNLTLREIGEILGVTESRICQIHSQVLRKLRTKLEVHEQLFLAATAA